VEPAPASKEGGAAPAAGAVRCLACPRLCVLAPEESGPCGARANWGGVLYATNHEELSALDAAPVEAIPLAAFRPGARALLVGGIGSPLPPELAPFRPAAVEGETKWASAAEVVDIARSKGAAGVAFAGGGEPLIALETLAPIAERARAEGLFVAAATSGYAALAAAREAAALLDAANVAVFASALTYALRLRGTRAPVEASLDALRERGVHLELTALVVAEEEPSAADLDSLCALARRLGDPPLHVSSPSHFEAAAPVTTVCRVHEALASKLPRVLLAPAYRHA
jgi:pyruvate formate lyase activating enzyme